MLQCTQADLGEQCVDGTVLRAEDPAHDDCGDGHRKQLRQIEQRAQEGSGFAAELLLDHVGEQRRDEQAEDGRDDHDSHDDPERVSEGNPERRIGEQAFPVFQADPLDGTDATPAGEAQVDVPDERNNNYREQADEAGDEVWNEFRGAVAGKSRHGGFVLASPLKC